MRNKTRKNQVRMRMRKRAGNEKGHGQMSGTEGVAQNYFVHESSYIDEDVIIGEGTKSGIFAMYRQGR